ncbi:hypothetical protein Pfo_015424 [Paulownia fortunei]|nr:hypothetical protein Pfo_015424 [Paulownia fortunei]
MKEEIRRIKEEEEEQATREALGLPPKHATKSQGNRLDKHEFAELVKCGSTAEDLGVGHVEATQVHGLGFSRGPRPLEESSLSSSLKTESVEKMNANIPTTSKRNDDEELEDESSRKKRKCEEKKRDKQEKHEKRRSSNSDDEEAQERHIKVKT